MRQIRDAVCLQLLSCYHFFPVCLCFEIHRWSCDTGVPGGLGVSQCVTDLFMLNLYQHHAVDSAGNQLRQFINIMKLREDTLLLSIFPPPAFSFHAYIFHRPLLALLRSPRGPPPSQNEYSIDSSRQILSPPLQRFQSAPSK